jgi:hypothetical protein
MTLARTIQRLAKKLTRKVRNLEAKRVRAAQRQIELVELGKTLVKKEVPGPEVDGKPTTVTTYELPEVQAAPAFNNPPHLSFVGMKRYRHHGLSMKNRPGNKELHAEAIVEDASRTFTKECDKAMGIPAVNGEPLTQE